MCLHSQGSSIWLFLVSLRTQRYISGVVNVGITSGFMIRNDIDLPHFDGKISSLGIVSVLVSIICTHRNEIQFRGFEYDLKLNNITIITKLSPQFCIYRLAKDSIKYWWFSLQPITYTLIHENSTSNVQIDYICI